MRLKEFIELKEYNKPSDKNLFKREFEHLFNHIPTSESKASIHLKITDYGTRVDTVPMQISVKQLREIYKILTR